ncbi:hypothetical protein SS50377_24988 [Spironucleus salmonicida]|uniref:Uncharacterized protein n=1 Tax=Spironucleus salmonicida TaxID=348837 RepID=A0A9P8LRH6_9EUKA|nr:hypothetical protein SS50377_24981 [Spironucleus salmonicida]KAH0572873.1 hypothetical protein SS50377_24988 [Spironucleus salmonicida]
MPGHLYMYCQSRTSTYLLLRDTVYGLAAFASECNLKTATLERIYNQPYQHSIVAQLRRRHTKVTVSSDRTCTGQADSYNSEWLPMLLDQIKNCDTWGIFSVVCLRIAPELLPYLALLLRDMDVSYFERTKQDLGSNTISILLSSKRHC